MAERWRAVLVDDEQLARESLKLALQGFPQIEIAAECANGYQALEVVRKIKPDLLFLDIQMPGLTGFDVIELLRPQVPRVIFVTAYDEYAIKAFEAHAFDYLLKPVNPKRLAVTIGQLKRDRIRWQEELDKLLLDSRSGERQDKIVVRDRDRVVIIPPEQIEYIKAEGDYVQITANGNNYLKYDRISRLEDILSGKYFVRIHRSYLVNPEFIHSIERNESKTRAVTLKSGASVPVSRSGWTKLKNQLNTG